MKIADQKFKSQKKIDLMLVSSAIGHEKALLQTSLDSDEDLRGVVSALDAEDSRMHLTLGVSVVAVGLATSKVMGKYETLAIGIAKVRLRRLYQLGRQLEVSIGR